MERRRLVVDLDGTLLDTRADLVRSVQHALAELDAPARTADEIIAQVGRGATFLMEQVLPPHERVESRVRRAVVLFREHYKAHIADATVLYPGVGDALQRLASQGRPPAVLTNKPGDLARRLVRKLGIAELLGEVLGPEDVPARKPDPAGLVDVCRRMGVACEQVWYVGDMDVDLQTARGAGCLAAAVTWGFGPRESLLAAGPDRLIADAAELPALE